jgi:hypothetical protein
MEQIKRMPLLEKRTNLVANLLSKYLESLQILSLPFTCTMTDNESSFPAVESEKEVKNAF